MTDKQRRSKRAALLALYGRHCWLCHEYIALNQVPTIDHLVPISKGGRHNIENLRLAHRSCNAQRGDGPASVLTLRAAMAIEFA